MTHVLLRDYESRSFADLKKVGAALYAADPSTEVMLASFAIDDEPVEYFIPGRDPIPDVFFEAARSPDWCVGAHNDFFDSSLEESNLAPRFNWPLVPLDRHFCTMALARFHGLPGSLEAVANILKLDARKDMAGRKLMLKLCKPGKDGHFIEPTPEEWEYFVAYCMRDTNTAREIKRALPPLPESEQALWCLDRAINERGFTADVTLALSARDLVEATKARVNARMKKVTGGAVEGATKHAALRKFVNAHGHKMTKTNKRAVAQVLANDPDDAVREVLELRKASANSAVEKYSAMLDNTFPDDHRIRGLLNYHGAITGRWSSARFNVHNLPREGAVDTAAAIAAIQSGDLDRVCAVGSPLDVLAAASRGLVIAPERKQFLIGDYTTLEPRCAAWFADAVGDLNNFREFDLTADPFSDIYRILGARMRGRPVDPEDGEARQRGKTVLMSFQYGGTAKTWRKMVPDDLRSDDEIKAQEVEKFRQFQPAQTEFMFDLGREALACVRSRAPVVRKRHSFSMDGDTLRLTLPSGRAISYRGAHIRPGKFGQDAVAYHAPAKKGLDDLWYGSLMAHLIQGTARDLLVDALFKTDAAGFEIVLHVHDEIIAEVPAGSADCEAFKRCMLDVPSWADGLPLAVKVRPDTRYIKTTETDIEPADIEPADIEDEVPFEIDEVPIAAAAVQTSDDWSVPHAGSIVDALLREHAAKSKTNGHANDGSNGHTDWRENYAAGESTTGTAASSYVYLAADGTPHMKVVRTTAKQFPTYHWDKGHWSKGWPPQVVPYRLPELLNAPADAIVLICEGEKDCDTAARHGFVATTNPGGAGKWQPELTAHFRGKQRVCLLEDNDRAGAGHVAAVSKALAGVVPHVGVLKFPELPPGGDLSDFFDAGGGEPYLRARIEQAMQAGTTQSAELDVVDACDLLSGGLPPPRQWLIKGCICRSFLSGLIAPGDTGKSTFRLTQAIELATGRELLGRRIYCRARVLVVSFEDDRAELWRRLLAICRHHGIAFEELKGWLIVCDLNGGPKLAELDSKGRRQIGELNAMLRRAIERYRIDFAVLDPFVKVHALNENDNPDMDFVCSLLVKLAQDCNIGVDTPAHTHKGAIAAGDADARRGASAQRDAGRLEYTLTPMTEAEARQFGIGPAERRDYVRHDKAKANIVRATGASWFRLVSVPLGNADAIYTDGDDVQAIERWEPPAIWEGVEAETIDAILDDFDAGLPNGQQRYSKHHNAGDARMAWLVVQRRCPDKTEAQCREIVRQWLQSDILFEKDFYDPIERKTRKDLFVNAGKRSRATATE